MNENKENQPAATDEIDLVEVFKKVWAGRKTIYKSIAVCFVIGIIIILGSPKEYKSEVTLLVESESKSGSMSGLLQQVSGLAGLNLGSMASGDNALTPQLYPDIIKSTPFLLEVIDQKVRLAKNDSVMKVVSFLDRYLKPSFPERLSEYTIGLPGTIMGLFRGKPKHEDTTFYTYKLTPEQARLTGELSHRIKVKEGETTGTLLISVEMQDPLVAAQLTDSVVKCLTKYIIDYKTLKTKREMSFIQARHDEAEQRYIATQRTLAEYKDRNKNVTSATIGTEQERLQGEYTLALSVFNGLSQQLEQSKIKVQESTPAFKVIEPAKMPMGNSSPKASLILVAMVFLGGFVGIGKILFKSFVPSN
jgi:uncharacterized protein involved in exopolysaccharide biosynthesis